MSRDEQSCLIVSYRELKQCVDQTFRELMKRRGINKK
jgi:PAB-dependent poly(A)-specific ribonuclease subunit 3